MSYPMPAPPVSSAARLDLDQRLRNDPETALRLLLRYAVMAPSSHNTQPWRFRIAAGCIELHADPDRWLPVADPNRRELYLSLGAALENLLVAAEHHGLRYDVVYFPDPDRPDCVARVSLARDPLPARSSLFPAIMRRRTNRRAYSGEPLEPGLLADLGAIAWSSGIWAWTTADAEMRRGVASLVARGDRIELADPAFREELGEWIGRGLLGIPRPLAGLARMAVTRVRLGQRMAERDAALVEGSAGLVVVLSKGDDPISQLRAGQALERVWLLATQLGLAVQPMSQPLQIPHLRGELAELIGAPDRYPQHLFRVGRAEPESRRASRRPVDEVLLA